MSRVIEIRSLIIADREMGRAADLDCVAVGANATADRVATKHAEARPTTTPQRRKLACA